MKNTQSTTSVPRKSSLGSFNPFLTRFLWMKEVGQQDSKRRQVRAQRAEIPQVDSPPPHRPGCFGVASRLLTPTGQKLMLLAKLTYSRRQFSPFGQRIRAVHTHLPPSCVLYIQHRTLYIGAAKRLLLAQSAQI